MLCQFTVGNYQCIKNQVTLDMQATSICEHEDSILRDADGENFLPLAVIYGPNGGGKTTVLKALYALACKIMKPVFAVSSSSIECTGNSNVIIEPYAFTKEKTKEPTTFELFFRTNINEYQYQLSVRKDKVVSEVLYKKLLKASSRYSLVFERLGSKNIKLHGSLKDYHIQDISETLPLISYLGITHSRNSTVKDIISWFQNEIDFLNYGNPYEDAKVSIVNRAAYKSIILKMLAEMDIDISDYRIQKTVSGVEVFTKHTVEGETYELPFGAESNGTIKVFSLLPHIAASLANGTILVVDELDAKLHPLLLKYIIKLYSNPEINRYKAQLIFTSHDLTTMSSEIFRRDEIWFVAKGNKQSSCLYSLVEIKERKDAAFSKHYLEGQYGADPYLRRIIEWGNV